MTRILLFPVFLAFSLYSAYVVYDVGYVGILRSHLSNAGGTQVLCDLTISLSLVCAWMFRDARAQRRNPWPFLLATLFLGSIGPLLYLLWRPRTQAAGLSGSIAANLVH